MRNRCWTKYILSGIICILFILCLTVTAVLAEPAVNITPTCGPSSPGFNVAVNANGFKPNHIVKWKLLDSQDRLPLYGYFQSNGTGGFNDVTFIDDLVPGTYRMYFGTDNSRAASILRSTTGPMVEITMPCPSLQQSSKVTVNSTATDAESNLANITLLSQRLKIGDSRHNDVIGQVKNIGNDTAESIKIGLTTYDKNGNILGTDSTYASADTLLPNQKTSFDILSAKDNFIGMKIMSYQYNGITLMVQIVT